MFTTSNVSGGTTIKEIQLNSVELFQNVYYDKDAERGDPDWIETSDLVFFNRNTNTSYVAFDVYCTALTTHGFAWPYKRYYINFKHHGKEYCIYKENSKWNLDDFFGIAEEMEYA